MSRPARVIFLCFWLLLCLCLSGVALPATKKPLLKPVNINSATSQQLQQVPGIGPATADKILQLRNSSGTFKSVDDLLAVRGIGRKRLDKMRKYLTVGKSSALPDTAHATTCPSCAKDASGKRRPPPVSVKPPVSKSAAKPLPTESDDEPEEPNLR